MTIIVSHISALQLYRSRLFDSENSGARQPVRTAESERALSSSAPSTNELNKLSPELFGSIEKPLHVLVQSETARSRSELIRCHIAPKMLPKRALTKIAPDVYACSPHLLFEQMATALPLTELVCLGYELCGDYRLSNGPERGFRKRSLLGTPDAFAQSLERGPGVRGRKKTALALQHIAANSASPMEAITAIPLALPCAYGGYGLPKPQLNYRIELPKNARATSGRSYLVADICWPDQGICVEYQSAQFHTGSERIDADARRQTALLECGFKVFEVTAQQALSTSGMDGVANAIAKTMGRRIRPKASWRARQAEMRAQLLRWHGFEA